MGCGVFERVKENGNKHRVSGTTEERVRGHYKDRALQLNERIHQRRGKNDSRARKDLRVSIAVELYKDGYSLGKVAEIADVDYDEMKRILVKSGIEIQRGVETVEELEEGARMLRNHRMK